MSSSRSLRPLFSSTTSLTFSSFSFHLATNAWEHSTSWSNQCGYPYYTTISVNSPAEDKNSHFQSNPTAWWWEEKKRWGLSFLLHNYCLVLGLLANEHRLTYMTPPKNELSQTRACHFFKTTCVLSLCYNSWKAQRQ